MIRSKVMNPLGVKKKNENRNRQIERQVDR